MHEFDVIIVGGGIIGLATAWTICKHRPSTRIALLEKEAQIASHQTGRNSGVIHAGIYYKPNSLRSSLCRRGKELLESFATEHNVEFKQCGKLVVATTKEELPALMTIRDRAKASGTDVRIVGMHEARELEPHVQAISALHVPSSGIIDYTSVCKAIAADVKNAGGHIYTNTRVRNVKRYGKTAIVCTSDHEFHAKRVITCGGLQADRIARLTGARSGATVIPFRGDYYQLKSTAQHLVRGLIYPVPNPRFPFLGVHFTKKLCGGVECGPNAVLSLSREGYHRTSFNLRDTIDTLSTSGVYRMMARNWRVGLEELIRSWSKNRFLQSLQRLVPDVTIDDLQTAPCGIRAQVVMKDGSLMDDFLIEREGPFVNVVNAPSPAATASFAIAETIAYHAGLISVDTGHN